MKNWHVFRISKGIHNNELQYYSTANSIYFSTSTAFASEIKTFYLQEKAKSEFRLLNKKYVAILEDYKKMLEQQEDAMYYLKMKPSPSGMDSNH